MENALPLLRPEVVVQRLSDDEYVIKLARRRQYFRVGPEEAALIDALREPQTRSTLQRDFQEKFDDHLSDEDIDEFLDLVRQKDLISDESSETSSLPVDDADEGFQLGKQSYLFYRIPFFDPDEKFNRWLPRLSWIWSVPFAIASLGWIGLAGLILWTSRDNFVTAFPDAMRWETLIIGWGVIIVATAFHEVAHGMTCKYFGGDVRETGVLFMFFMPCLYCNVSDAWLIREKWKRLLITAAGAYCDLCIWAFAVFVWRVTAQNTMVNYVAFLTVTICGSRSLLNFNPLLRLDGYYLLSDWLSIPNLRPRAHEYWMSRLRHVLWGAAKPKTEPRGWTLFLYGMGSWAFAIVVLDMVFVNLLQIANDQMGLAGLALGVLLLLAVSKRVFKGFFRSEFMKMLQDRPGHTMKWIGGVIALLVAAFVIPVKNYATGAFEVRSGQRHQIAIPVAGFIREVYAEDGQRVDAGTPLVKLESADIDNQIAVKQSEIKESEAILRKLQAGPRPEEIDDQKARIARLQTWVEMGLQELERAKVRLEHELAALEQVIAQTNAQLSSKREAHTQSKVLYQQGAVAGSEIREELTRIAVLESELLQAQASKKAREAEGTRAAEAELLRRQQDLADEEARLRLMLSGTRPEILAAEEARNQRLHQELDHLEEQKSKLIIKAPFEGFVSRPRMFELIGTYVAPGTQLCFLEDSSNSFIEISVPEEEIGGVIPGQQVNLKARAIPFETFQASVDHIATSTKSAVQSDTNSPELVVYCELANPDGRLRTGMSGFGRIDRGWRSVGATLANKGMKYLRTEFWW